MQSGVRLEERDLYKDNLERVEIKAVSQPCCSRWQLPRLMEQDRRPLRKAESTEEGWGFLGTQLLLQGWPLGYNDHRAYITYGILLSHKSEWKPAFYNKIVATGNNNRQINVCFLWYIAVNIGYKKCAGMKRHVMIVILGPYLYYCGRVWSSYFFSDEYDQQWIKPVVPGSLPQCTLTPASNTPHVYLG